MKQTSIFLLLAFMLFSSACSLERSTKLSSFHYQKEKSKQSKTPVNTNIEGINKKENPSIETSDLKLNLRKSSLSNTNSVVYKKKKQQTNKIDLITVKPIKKSIKPSSGIIQNASYHYPDQHKQIKKTDSNQLNLIKGLLTIVTGLLFLCLALLFYSILGVVFGTIFLVIFLIAAVIFTFFGILALFLA